MSQQCCIGGKTNKTSILPRFSKIEDNRGSGGTLQCYDGLTSSGHTRRSDNTAVSYNNHNSAFTSELHDMIV